MKGNKNNEKFFVFRVDTETKVIIDVNEQELLGIRKLIEGLNKANERPNDWTDVELTEDK